MNRRVVSLFAVLLLVAGPVACSPLTVGTSSQQQRQSKDTTQTEDVPQPKDLSQTEGSGTRLDVWYSTYEIEKPSLIRKASDRSIVATGDEFKLSPNGQRAAVLAGTDLGLLSVDGGAALSVSSNVWSFGWRPETQELYYVVRVSASPQEAEWRIRQSDGIERVVVRAPLVSLLSAQVSTTGHWLVYTLGPRLVVVSLRDGTQARIDTQPHDNVSAPIWADEDHVSVIESGSRVVLIQVPTGDRKVFGESGAELLGPDVWSHDGSSVAVGSTVGTEIFLKGRKPVECQGFSTPLGWSPDGRYLALRSGNKTADFRLYILDTSTEPFNCDATLIPGAQSLEAWAPNSSQLIVKSWPTKRLAGHLQVWELTVQGPALTQDIGEGSNATWVAR